MTNALLTGRVFQLWEYQVGHGKLLVRSPRSKERITNIDIICGAVEYFELPTFIPNLQIEEGSEEEIQRAKRLLGKRFHRTAKVHAFVISGERFIVVLCALQIRENSLEFYEKPIEFSPNA
jgi:hypothetical protein